MKLYFESRSRARNFSNGANRRVKDEGSRAPVGRRWGVEFGKSYAESKSSA